MASRKCPGCGADMGMPHVDTCPKLIPRHRAQADRTAAREQAIEKAKERQKRMLAQARGAVDELLKTEAGKQLWAYLFNYLGYNRSSIAVDPVTGDVQDRATQHNETRRAVYIHLRGLASRKLLAPVEDAAESQDENEGEK